MLSPRCHQHHWWAQCCPSVGPWIWLELCPTWEQLLVSFQRSHPFSPSSAAKSLPCKPNTPKANKILKNWTEGKFWIRCISRNYMVPFLPKRTLNWFNVSQSCFLTHNFLNHYQRFRIINQKTVWTLEMVSISLLTDSNSLPSGTKLAMAGLQQMRIWWINSDKLYKVRCFTSPANKKNKKEKTNITNQPNNFKVKSVLKHAIEIYFFCIPSSTWNS